MMELRQKPAADMFAVHLDGRYILEIEYFKMVQLSDVNKTNFVTIYDIGTFYNAKFIVEFQGYIYTKEYSKLYHMRVGDYQKTEFEVITIGQS